MSWDALAWAAKCKVGKAADKLVLLGLADRHNPETNTAYPSVAWLADFSSLNRKTVITSLDRLEALGLISDSGERAGKTRQVKAYRLAIGTVPKTEQSQKRNSPRISGKQSQKRDTEPVLEPVSSEDKSSSGGGSDEIKLTVDHLKEAWNDGPGMTGAVPCRRIGPDRRQRVNTYFRTYTVDEITQAIMAVQQSDFLCGRTKESFRADIDFLFSPKHMNRLLEGFYGRKSA
jgi:hypothetical protein